jgi:hypothetical protein
MRTSCDQLKFQNFGTLTNKVVFLCDPHWSRHLFQVVSPGRKFISATVNSVRKVKLSTHDDPKGAQNFVFKGLWLLADANKEIAKRSSIRLAHSIRLAKIDRALNSIGVTTLVKMMSLQGPLG